MTTSVDEGKVPPARTQHWNNVPIFWVEKHLSEKCVWHYTAGSDIGKAPRSTNCVICPFSRVRDISIPAWLVKFYRFPGDLRQSSLLLGFGGSPQNWIFTSEQGRNISFLSNMNARARFEPAIADFPIMQLQPLHQGPRPCTFDSVYDILNVVQHRKGRNE